MAAPYLTLLCIFKIKLICVCTPERIVSQGTILKHGHIPFKRFSISNNKYVIIIPITYKNSNKIDNNFIIFI